jgi:hypothetical protein
MMSSSKIRLLWIRNNTEGKAKKSNQEEARSSGRNVLVDVETICTGAASRRKKMKGRGVAPC